MKDTDGIFGATSRWLHSQEARRRLYRLSHFSSRMLEAELDRLSTLAV